MPAGVEPRKVRPAKLVERGRIRKPRMVTTKPRLCRPFIVRDLEPRDPARSTHVVGSEAVCSDGSSDACEGAGVSGSAGGGPSAIGIPIMLPHSVHDPS